MSYLFPCGGSEIESNRTASLESIEFWAQWDQARSRLCGKKTIAGADLIRPRG